MATLIEPPKGFRSEGKRCYTMWETVFEVDFKYVPIKALGRGSYGAVCSSMNMETYEKVAIKKIGDIFASPLDALRTLREMKLLRQIQHEYVIALKDVMTPLRRTSFTDVYLVFELMDTDLYHIIKSPQPLSNDHCQYFLFQLLRGLDYLHSAKILHCDLKPENLLVNANCDLKICDFGLARTCQGHGEPVTEYLVTRWYRAPELLLGCRSYGFPIDVWSVGCIFAELLRRKPLFPGRDILNQLELIIGILGTPSEADLDFIDDPIARKYVDSFPDQAGIPLFCLFPEAGPLAIDLLSKMLRFNPTRRYTVREALEHPYLSDLYDPSYDLPANVPVHLDMGESLEAGEIREMMWREMLHFHPEAAGSDACVDKSTADRNT